MAVTPGAMLLAVVQFWPWFLPVVGAILGAVMGSFVACMVQRWPHGLAWRQPPSHCPHCRVVLGPAQLIPLVSYLWQRGRCHACAHPIGPALWWAEFTLALLGFFLTACLQRTLINVPVF